MKTAANLFLDRTTWDLTLQTSKEVVDVDNGHWDSDRLDVVAQRIAESLDEADARVHHVTILLGASLCLPACFTCESQRQARSAEALGYRLEEAIPLAAEDVLADFQRDGLSVFAVATRRAPMEAWVLALGERGLTIDFVTPEASLAWEYHLGIAKGKQHSAAMWQTNHETQLIEFQDRRPIAWQVLSNEPTELRQHLKVQRLGNQTDDQPILLYQPSKTSDASGLGVVDVDHSTIHVIEGPTLRESATKRLSEIRAGRQRVPFDLTPVTGKQSARGPLRLDLAAFQLAIIVLLGSFVFSAWQQLQRAQSKTDQHVMAQEEVFRELFPESRLPVGVLSRLKSERGKLAGVRGKSEDQVDPISVLPILHRFLSAVPSDMRLRIVSSKIDGEGIDLSGEVREFADADRLAAALRSAGFLVTPPRTSRLPDQGVSFRLEAQLPNEEGNDG